MIWKNDYNLVRPHSAIGNLAPSIYAELSAPGTQRVGRKLLLPCARLVSDDGIGNGRDMVQGSS